MARKNGSILGKTVTTSRLSAGGIWSLQEQFLKVKDGLWPSDTFPVEYLIVAGGGGASGAAAGGGGAGGYLNSVPGELSGENTSAVSVFLAQFLQTYTVTIGAGGAASASQYVWGTSGSNSELHTIIAIGGGHGGAANEGRTGATGGSGGGNSVNTGSPIGGLGTTGQGFAGGGSFSTAGAGGGGGAGEVGETSTFNGGDGLESNITGTPTYRGGGGSGRSTTTGGVGGLGGGGATNTAGTANTGGGGGAGTPGVGSGGSGVVILKYFDYITLSNPSGGLTYSTSVVGDYNVTTITAGTGTISFTA